MNELRREHNDDSGDESISPDRLTALLADRALGQLSDNDSAELEVLLSRAPADFDAGAFDRAAAAVALGSLDESLEMPPTELLRQIQRDATAVLRQNKMLAIGQPPQTILPPAKAPAASTPQASSVTRWLPTLAAAALLAMTLYLRFEPEPSASLAEARSSLLIQAKDARPVPWTATPDPAAQGASGDVVWSDSQQAGFMRFQGLPANNPNVSQYQLWIFDDARDARYPVDGGVFNIPAANGEVIIPILARLRVHHATVFAVTIEKPGGVVVSDRKRLPLLAKVQS